MRWIIDHPLGKDFITCLDDTAPFPWQRGHRGNALALWLSIILPTKAMAIQKAVGALGIGVMMFFIQEVPKKQVGLNF